MRMKWIAGAIGIGLVLALVGLAGAWWIAQRKPLPWSPPPQPRIAWAEFARPEDAQPPIKLAGHWSNQQVESLLAGFRDQSAGDVQAEKDAAWVVRIADTDGRQWRLVVRSQAGGQVWQAGATSGPVLGDLDRFLQAHRGIQILNLASGTPADRQRLEESVAAEGELAIDGLLALARSTDDRERAMALRGLNVILSPRLRREARLNGGVSETGPFEPARAGDHPRAAEVRELAVSLLDAWSADPAAATMPGMTESALFETLAELRDQNVADKLAAALRSRQDADYPAERIMQALERVYGLPPAVEPLHFCSTGESQASIARAAAAAHSRRQQRRVLLLAWHQAHRSLPREDQLQAAVAAWEPIVAERQPHYLVGHPILMQSTFGPLLVQGTDVLPALTDAQERTSGLPRRAVYEALITLISGERDVAFLAELMRGDPIEREMAGEIMAIPTGN